MKAIQRFLGLRKPKNKNEEQQIPAADTRPHAAMRPHGVPPTSSPAHRQYQLSRNSPDVIGGLPRDSPRHPRLTPRDSPSRAFPANHGASSDVEHTPDLLNVAENNINFHSPLWMKRDFPSRSSMKKRAASGRRLPVDMNVRFNDYGALDSGLEDAIATDTEVMRRRTRYRTDTSDLDTDTQTDIESIPGRKKKKSKLFSRHSSLKIKGKKQKAARPDDSTLRRASVGSENKLSLTDTEPTYESETDSSFNRSADHFRRQGSAGNLMGRRNFGSRNEMEITNSNGSVKKSYSSDNFQTPTQHLIKHKIGQGLARSSVKPARTKKHSKGSSPQDDLMVTLFESVEVCNMDKVKDILLFGLTDINIPNEDEFTILDMAILLNFDTMAAELLKHGARENQKFLVKELRLQHISHLLKRCESQIHSLVVVNLSANQQRASQETELRFWEWRQRLLVKMKACFELARAPEPPSSVDLIVTSSTSLLVSFTHPKNNNGSIVTRYRISWSKSANFENIEGEHVMVDTRDLSFTIRGLMPGKEIFVRVSAANIKGFGQHQSPVPSSATPSNWRDISNRELRCSGKKVTELSLLYEQIRFSCLGSNLDGSPNRKSTIKHLLPSHPKFVKTLNRGVYLSCALYTPDDRVVVTNDDVIPTVEVDEGTPANISQDFHWFLKMSVVWEDIPTLCQDLDLGSQNTSIAFRAKLIQAVFSLQALLSWREVGRVYHRVLRDNHGNMVFVLIGHLNDSRCPSGSNVKLAPLNKVIGKRRPKLDQSTTDAGSTNGSSSLLDDFSALDMLFLDLEELIRFHQHQDTVLKPGLYMTVLKAESSINTLNVQVPYNCPNMTSCVKIRDNSHVSREEWSWIQNESSPPSQMPSAQLTPTQANFRRALAIAAGKLFRKLGVKEDDGFRIHKDEIIEVNSDVSVIVMLPPEVTSVNKQADVTAAGPCVPLTVQLFEFTHLLVYQHYITAAYCRLCALLDTLTLVTNYQLREAFTDDEMRAAKRRLDLINQATDTCEHIWHSMRWVLDILQQNRLSRNSLGIPLKTVLESSTPSENSSSASNKHHLPEMGTQHPKKTKCNVLQVYPRFNSGLPKGTSVRVVINAKATCKDVVALVISELSKASIRHNPTVSWDANPDLFQLCVVIGDQLEQTLPEHLPPLSAVDYQPNTVKYIIKLRTNASFTIKYSDI